MDLTRYQTESRNLERETIPKPISMESSYDVQKLVLQRIQTLEPENASRIMGYILIQEHGERDMVRLACASDDVLHAYVARAKAYFGLTSPKPTNPLPISVTPNAPFHTSPRILIPNNGGFHLQNNNSPSSPIAPAFPRTSPRPISYASVLNGGKNSSGSVSGLHFYSGNNEFSEDFFGGGRAHHRGQELVDDSMVNPIISPSGMSDSMIFHHGEETNSLSSPHPFHRRSCSVNDAAFLSNFVEEGGNGGFGWRPCMYYARGFCKNGNNCKFLHRDIGEAAMEAGSPNTTLPAEFDEYFRLKALEQQQQRLSLMGSGGHYPFQRNRYFNFLSDHQRNDFASLVMGGGANSSSRQIYLTFPAESTFKEEDVSSYFSMFGPVQDVRIPYQQKRMFGFVTFVYAETVKLILAKGNPHYVCDSRVLVKPYKEKGKILDKKQLHHQQLERGDYPASLSPSGMDRELYDLPIGPRMLLNSQEIVHRRKLEQAAELQHAIELQGRRMADLQLMGSKNQHHNHPLFLQGFSEKSEDTNQDVSHELEDGREASKSPVDVGGGEKLVQQGTESSTSRVLRGNKHQHVNDDDSYLHESTEYFLPDNLFPSPTKFAAEHQSAFSHASAEANNDIPITNTASNSSPLSMASLSYSQMTRSH